ncbi:hypothetical protein NDU88_002578 [Pleurodeles waltl]|uniref:Uncharacterized protein n=1 Tax=Pleurodeles waltl TaxID=8319 RepID=A0AAV7QDC3_PLEWA|nr:hypothetical protein NDU88_002578 [Pleurodeles waltl]
MLTRAADGASNNAEWVEASNYTDNGRGQATTRIGGGMVDIRAQDKSNDGVKYTYGRGVERGTTVQTPGGGNQQQGQGDLVPCSMCFTLYIVYIYLY